MTSAHDEKKWHPRRHQLECCADDEHITCTLQSP
jgi:hypothetical protein